MLKDLTVFLNGGDADAQRLAHASALAQEYDAHLTGLFCNYLPEIILGADIAAAGAEMIAQMQNDARSRGNDVEAALKAQFDTFGFPAEVKRFDAYPGWAASAVAAEARRSDVFVGSRPDPDPDNTGRVFETVLFDSGTPCLLTPPKAKPAARFDTVLLAWANTREATLATALSLPLLKAATRVVLAMVVDSATEEAGEMPGADMAEHLDRHGVKVELKHLTGWSDAGEALLKEAGQAGAQLLVMGGYGHSRLRERVLGGVTRKVLHTAQIPVLMAH